MSDQQQPMAYMFSAVMLAGFSVAAASYVTYVHKQEQSEIEDTMRRRELARHRRQRRKLED